MRTIARFLGNLRIWPGPILAVELITMSRRARYYALRVLYAAALFFALWINYEGSRRYSASDINSIAQFASDFFQTFGVMQLMAVMLIGPALAAGTIAQERERRTMEYLYASPLSNLEIVIGKLGGRVLQIIYLVLAGMPVLALAMLLGGIAPVHIVVLTAITISTALFVTMVSIAVSAWTARARDAVIRAYLLFFCIWVLPLLTAALAFSSRAAWSIPLVQQFLVADPVVTFMSVFTGDSPWGPVSEPWTLLWALVRNQMIVGGAVLTVATSVMRRVHLREAGKAARKRRWRLWGCAARSATSPCTGKRCLPKPAPRGWASWALPCWRSSSWRCAASRFIRFSILASSDTCEWAMNSSNMQSA